MGCLLVGRQISQLYFCPPGLSNAAADLACDDSAVYDAHKRNSRYSKIPELTSLENLLTMPSFLYIPLSAWIGFGVSIAVCGLIVLTQDWHGPFTFDTYAGPQKFHEKATPRIGGTALFLGLCVAALFTPPPTRELLVMLGLCGVIAFFAGLSEDLWKKTHPALRLAVAAGAALFFCLLSGYRVTRLDIPVAGEFMLMPFISAAFTVFAITGLMNAVNIIDGFHGLASGSVILMTGAFGIVVAVVGDYELLVLATIMIAVLLGFLTFNFPFGHLFLGDGGAYVSGFWLGCLAVMLPERNPEVSVWLSFLIVLYPVAETMYSIFRRIARRRSPMQPDSWHLHQLVHRSFATLIGKALQRPRFINPITSVLLWCLHLPGLLLAVALPRQELLLFAGIVLQITLYAVVYRWALVLRPWWPTQPSRYGQNTTAPSAKAPQMPQDAG